MVLPITAAGAAAASDAAAAGGDPAAAAASVAKCNTIKEGDLVIVYESFQSIKHVYVDSKAQFQNRYGCFNHKVSWSRCTVRAHARLVQGGGVKGGGGRLQHWQHEQQPQWQKRMQQKQQQRQNCEGAIRPSACG
jgi:hypothetical protein